MKRKVLLIPIVLFLFLVKAYSQEKYTISGIISDAETGETMIGATISVKELDSNRNYNQCLWLLLSTITQR
jgi:hypothetical protein